MDSSSISTPHEKCRSKDNKKIITATIMATMSLWICVCHATRFINMK